MIVEPDFIHHWKFEALCTAVGDGLAAKALLRLWGYAQSRKQWIFPLDALKLASICGVREDLEGFWSHMTGRAGWIEARGGGWFELRGWAHLNRAMIQAWCTKTKRLPWMDDYDAAMSAVKAADAPVVVVAVSGDEMAKAGGESCGGSGGAAYDATNRGDGIEEIEEIKIIEKIEVIGGREETEGKAAGERPPAELQSRCSLEQAIAYGPMCQLSAQGAAFWWHTRNATDWYRASAGGGPGRKVTSWQSDMSTSRHWAEAGAEKQREKEGKRRVVVRL
jgi:hypothetical protein